MFTIGLVTMLLLTVLTESSFANNKFNEKHWQINQKLTKSLPCDHPQPRSVPLHELITEDDADIYYIFGRTSTLHVIPESVVLHRCDNAGCCYGRKKTCSIDKEEQLILTFKYYTSSNSDYINLSVSNHTKCTCSEIRTNNIK